MTMLERLDAWLARFVAQPDKVLHFLVGMAIAATLAVVLSDIGTLWACGLIAWGKERYDKAHPDVHTPDGWDAFATVAGSLLALTLWAIYRQ